MNLPALKAGALPLGHSGMNKIAFVIELFVHLRLNDYPISTIESLFLPLAIFAVCLSLYTFVRS